MFIWKNMERCGNINPEAMIMFEILKKQGQIQSIAVSDIVPNRFQPRRVFDEGELSALGESIRENGLIQPISVRRVKGGFELIAGERRLRASELIGRKRIEAVVYDIGDEDSAVWALIENLQRSDLLPFDEAEGISRLLSVWNIPREDAARRLGISASALSNKLRILKLEPEVREVITENRLTERHAREILRVPKAEDRLFVIKTVAERQLNVPETVKFIDRFLEDKKPRKRPKFIVRDLRLFINTFEHAVEVMNSAGLCAVSTVSEDDESIVYSVSVPKAKAYRKAE